MSTVSKNKDEIEEAIGHFGRWQLLICFVLSLFKTSVAWHQLAIVFLAPPTLFHCSGDRNKTCFWDNGTSCEHWEYDKSVFESTIISEWDLVCTRTQFANITQTIFMLGILLGNLFFGHAADRFGRKSPLLIAMVFQVVSGVGTSLVHQFPLFLLLRFIDAFTTGGLMVTTFVICVEIVGTKWRSIVVVMYHLPFAIGHLTLPGLSFLFRDWRSLQMALSLPSALLFVSYWIVPESPRWLLAKGHQSKAESILKQAAIRNGRNLDKIELVLANSQEKSKNTTQKSTIIDLFRIKNLRLRTAAICFNWMVCGLCFFGVAQYMGQIAGDIFLNVTAGGSAQMLSLLLGMWFKTSSGLKGIMLHFQKPDFMVSSAVASMSMTCFIEIPGTFLCMYCMEKLGRRKTLLIFQMLAGCSCFLITTTSGWPVVMFSTLGIVGMSVAFPTVYLYSGELFPTVVRNAAVGFGSMCARIGSMAAPFISDLDKISSTLPPIVFGIFPIVASLLCLLLPETKGVRLSDTIDDIAID